MAKVVTGRARKEQLMPRALDIAAKGDCRTFNDVLAKMGDDGPTLKLWCSVADRDAINNACRKGIDARYKSAGIGVRKSKRRR